MWNRLRIGVEELNHLNASFFQPVAVRNFSRLRKKIIFGSDSVWRHGQNFRSPVRRLCSFPEKISAALVEENGFSQEEKIEDRELHKEASESYLAYAMSVIVGRALPDARDGLKPVHRRILYAMDDLGISHNKPHKKCARVVGEVLGKYHPHGDSAVYDALVRMAQDFSMRTPLISGHGNFGSIDDDPPAAMRYTECRLQAFTADALLADLGSDTVDFIPTFDASQNEPSLLPAKIPNLLVNGSAGIAVGVATKIPPHNMGEVVAGLRALIHNPEISIEQLMKIIPAPDFPTGGEILMTPGLRQAYLTGNGSVVMRCKAQLEEEDENGQKRKKNSSSSAIIITELPYQTNKGALVENIVQLVENRTLEGISDVRDESDRTGIRVVVEVKRGAMAQVVLNNLYKHTKLQTSFACNMVALVNGSPQKLNLKDFLVNFLEFRVKVVERRAKFHLREANARLHLVVGFLIAMENINEVIKTIKAAKDGPAARKELCHTFQLSEEQAEGILGLSLRRLTSFEATKLAKERDELKGTVAKLENLLYQPDLILKEIEKEASALARKCGDPRRSSLVVQETGELSDLDVIPNDPSIIVFSQRGFIKRMKPDNFITRKRGGKGVYGAKMRDDDSMGEILHVKAHDKVLFFTEGGIVHTVRAYQIPEASRTASGTVIKQVLPGLKDDAITRMMTLNDVDPDKEFLVMLTKKGLIKRTKISEYTKIRGSGLIAMKTNAGDKVGWVAKCTNESTVLIASNSGKAVRFGLWSLVPRSRGTLGVKAMRLKDGAQIVGMVVSPSFEEFSETSETSESESMSESEFEGEEEEEEEEIQDPSTPSIMLLTEKGFGKRVAMGHFPRNACRGNQGIIALKLRDDDRLVDVRLVGADNADEELIVASEKGMVTRMSAKSIPMYGRIAKGVVVMNLREGDRIQSVTTMSA